MRRRELGFTLLEVIVAVFVFASVMGALITMVQQNLARIADARYELQVLRLAEERIRAIQSAAESGTLPELGQSEGAFEEPHADFFWELDVSRFKLPLPADYPEGEPLTSVFTDGPGGGGNPPGSLRLVELRVYPAAADPAAFDPMLAILVEHYVGAPDEGQPEF